MSDDATTAEAEDNTATTETETEKSVPYERFDKVNRQAKEAKAQAAQLSKQMAELQAQMEERESAGLPELERERKRAEQLEKRATEAEKKAEAQEKAAITAGRKALVLAAASAAGFDESDDALRYPEFVNLEEIETKAEAERAVKQLAKAKPKLLKSEDPQLPGRVLQNGQATTPAVQNGGIDPNAEAQMLADQLKTFLKSRKSTAL